VIFISECTRNRLSAELRPHSLGELTLTAVPKPTSCDEEGRQRRQTHKGDRGIEEGYLRKKGREEKRESEGMGRDMRIQKESKGYTCSLRQGC